MKIYDNKDVKLRIKEIMKEKNLTIYKLEKSSGIPRTTIRDVINNPDNNPKVSTLLKIIYAMEEDPASFFAPFNS
jgi:predicted transcriptional regulator